MAIGDYKTVILGTYLNDGVKLDRDNNFMPTTDCDECLLPIVNSLKDSIESSVYFVDPDTGKKLHLNFETPEPKGGGRRSALNNTFSDSGGYMNADLGGLISSPISVCLNLSGTNIMTSDLSGMVQVFPPVGHAFLAKYEGSVLLYDIITINIATLHQALNEPDIIKNVTNGSLNASLNANVYSEAERALRAFGVFDGKNRSVEEIRSQLKVNCIKVVVLSIIDKKAMTRVHHENDTIHIPAIGKHVSPVSVNSRREIVAYNGNIRDENLSVNYIEGGLFRIYIVDNKKVLGPKFTKMGPSTVLIPSITDVNKQDGLYVCTPTGKEVVDQRFMALEEINDIEYIYNSIEECNNGFNVREIEKDRREAERAREKERKEQIAHERNMELESKRYENSLLKTETEKVVIDNKTRDKMIEQMNDLFEDRMKVLSSTIERLNDVKRKNEDHESDYFYKQRTRNTDLELVEFKLKAEKEKLKMEENLSQWKFGVGVLGAVAAGMVIVQKFK